LNFSEAREWIFDLGAYLDDPNIDPKRYKKPASPTPSLCGRDSPDGPSPTPGGPVSGFHKSNSLVQIIS